MDFLKSHPNVTRDEYMWEWTVPQILLASFDSTHLVYLKDRRRRGGRGRHGRVSPQRKYDGPEAFVNDLGLPIFNNDKK